MIPVSIDQAKIDLSISIVTFDSPYEELLRCLESIRGAADVLCKKIPAYQIHITLVNNSPGGKLDVENVCNRLSAQNYESGILQGHGNVGYGSGQNLAFNSRKSKYHLFMNPDVEIDPDSLLEGIEYLENNPDVGIVGPKAVNRAGTRQFLCKRYPTVLDLFLRGFISPIIRRRFRARLARYEMQDLSDSDSQKGIPITSGCFMLCRSKVIKRIDGFDPKFFLYFEDFDLCLRAGEISTVAYVPTMRIQHFGGDSARKGIRHILMFVSSAFRFFSKHGWKWVRQR